MPKIKQVPTKPFATRRVGMVPSRGDTTVLASYPGFTEKFHHSLAADDVLENHFHWEGRAVWRTEILTPIRDRRTDHSFIDSKIALCMLPAFREEILDIRHQRSKKIANLDSIVQRVCESWKIRNGHQWIKWLIENWDPMKMMVPGNDSRIPPDSFPPWTIQLNYLKDPKSGAESCRCATISLNAGISGREAQRATALAQQALDHSKRRRGRPGLSEFEKAGLRARFEQLGIPQRGKRLEMIRKVRKLCKATGKGRFSETVIGTELRRWLCEAQQPVKRYLS